MAFKIDFANHTPIRWSATPDGVSRRADPDYRPRFHVGAGDPAAGGGRADALGTAAERLRTHPAVADVDRVRRRRGWRYDPEVVLEVSLDRLEELRSVAATVRGWGDPTTYRCYDVDLSPEFRYSLAAGLDPTPDRPLRTLELDAPPHRCREPPVAELVVGDRRIDEGPDAALEAVEAALDRVDPDVLVCSTAALVPTLFEQARRRERPGFALGRAAGYRRLAGRSTYESYGRVGHSPARYNVPGRVIVDRQNTFVYEETNLAGCLDLVGRSRRPLQELSWASIGRILTSIQIRHARERDVLVPWRSWRPERFKTARQHHAADRGGVTFEPTVGVHDEVYELDFASLYPNVIVTRNLSPETIRCDCHPGREDVPGLGYAICPEDGYLPEVLRPLIEDRQAMKDALASTDDPARERELTGRISALKWILVSCFGYQGFANAKFGRIENHEAINAFAREILLTAKRRLESAGWRLLHGVVDSLWVTPAPDRSQRPLREVATGVTEEVGIPLEYEGEFEWFAFVPRRDSATGALTKYFGKRAAGGFKHRGIECRQRSTCEFVAEAQRELIRVFDIHREPEPVCAWLQAQLGRVRRGEVPTDELAITQRASRPASAYDHRTRTVAALERVEDAGRSVHPGQRVEYVVVDDDVTGPGRVELADAATAYDPGFYRDRLIRAAASVLAPVGWRAGRIRTYLAEHATPALSRFRSDTRS